MPQTVFCWQGGEPTLMGLPFYQSAVSLMQRYGRGQQSVSNALQTNGLLLDKDWCEFLRNYHFLVGISLDGPAEYHDKNRLITPGKGTHAEVLGKTKLMRDHGVEFNILTVVSAANAGHAKEVYSYFREMGQMHMQFIPCVESNPETLQPEPFSVTPEAYGDFMCEIFDLWLPEALNCVSVRLFDGLLGRELTGNSGLCSFETICGHCPVIEYNGDVYPCDFFVQPEWRMGNVMTMPFEKLHQRKCAREFRSAKFHLPTECDNCEWKELCKGGCLKDRQRITGGFDAASYFCVAYKHLFKHIHAPMKELANKVRAPCQQNTV